MTKTNINKDNYENDITNSTTISFFVKIKLEQVIVWKLALMHFNQNLIITIDWGIAQNKVFNSQKTFFYL